MSAHSPVVFYGLYVLNDLGIQLTVERMGWVLTAGLRFEEVHYPGTLLPIDQCMVILTKKNKNISRPRLLQIQIYKEADFVIY